MSDYVAKKKSLSWPMGSFGRAFPNSKGILDELEKAKRNKNQAASQTMVKETVQDAMSKAVKAIELVYSSDFNLPEAELKRLNALPVNTVEEINFWKDQWLKLLK